MRRVRQRAVMVFAVALVLVLSACTTDWATWGNGPDRHGENRLESKIGVSNVSQLTQKWSVDLGAISNTAPIVANGLEVNGTKTDVVFVGNEHGMFFAISSAGSVLWSRDLGSQTTGCDDTPDGTFGVTGSAVFDRPTNRVFVAGGDGYVHAFDASTGTPADGWPVQLTPNPVKEVVWGGPVINGDHLYFELASHCSGQPYHGQIVDIDPTTAVVAHRWYVTGENGTSGGGIWGWGGASVDTATGDLFVATGNTFVTPENPPYAESVVRLTSDLQVVAADSQPPTMVNDDFGSTPVLIDVPNCPKQFVVERKHGSLYLYDRDAIASGPTQTIAFGTPYFFGVPAYSTKNRMFYVVNQKGSPDHTYVPGIAAFKVNASCRLELAWQTRLPTSNGTAPSFANGVVYVTSGGSGKVYALNALTGELLWDSGASMSDRAYSQAVIANGTLYAVSWDMHLHAWGVPAPPPSSTTTSAPGG
jgi:outer membrane protein assembly factor BamB